jgi:hypothetical protein
MKSFQTILTALCVALVLAIGSRPATVILPEAAAQSASINGPPGVTPAWANFSASITGSSTGTLIAASAGKKIVILYAEFSAAAATVIQLQDHPAAGSNVNIATVGLGATSPFPLPQNDFFGGYGYVTGAGTGTPPGAGDSILIENLGSTTTVSGTCRYYYN